VKRTKQKKITNDSRKEQNNNKKKAKINMNLTTEKYNLDKLLTPQYTKMKPRRWKSLGNADYESHCPLWWVKPSRVWKPLQTWI